jgi:prefoldin subunit 5
MTRRAAKPNPKPELSAFYKDILAPVFKPTEDAHEEIKQKIVQLSSTEPEWWKSAEAVQRIGQIHRQVAALKSSLELPDEPSGSAGLGEAMSRLLADLKAIEGRLHRLEQALVASVPKGPVPTVPAQSALVPPPESTFDEALERVPEEVAARLESRMASLEHQLAAIKLQLGTIDPELRTLVDKLSSSHDEEVRYRSWAYFFMWGAALALFLFLIRSFF